ncbi:hypothetical protein THAOC_07319, partial [Thalassiosira oceanica]
MTLAADEEAQSPSVPSTSPAPAAAEEDDGFAQFMAFLQSPSGTAGGSAEPHKGVVEGASKLVTMMVPPADEEDENGGTKKQPPASPAKEQARTGSPKAANYNDLIKKNSKKNGGKKGKKKKNTDIPPASIKQVLSFLPGTADRALLAAGVVAAVGNGLVYPALA